jgi:HEAT repeat protein
METALKQARSGSSSTPFWTAYAFDVRPGIAVDVDTSRFDGRTNVYGDTTVSIGTSNGVRIETRNLGIFMLHDSSSGAITRVEIYNLDRKREYSGYPVYWLGRGGNQESLNFLQPLVQSNQSNRIAEHLIIAIALHDDPRISGILKEYVRSSSQNRVRSTAVFWLGQIGGEQQFLAELVRNQNENLDVRKEAAFAIGAGKDPNALPILKSLYDSANNSSLREQIIFAVSINEDKSSSVDFLIKAAQSDPDRGVRRQAIFWLGQMAGQKALEALGNTVDDTDAETEVQKQVVFAISQRNRNEAVPALIRIARTHPKAAVRKQAIFWLGQIDDERALELFKEILTK